MLQLFIIGASNSPLTTTVHTTLKFLRLTLYIYFFRKCQYVKDLFMANGPWLWASRWRGRWITWLIWNEERKQLLSLHYIAYKLLPTYNIVQYYVYGHFKTWRGLQLQKTTLKILSNRRSMRREAYILYIDDRHDKFNAANFNSLITMSSWWSLYALNTVHCILYRLGSDDSKLIGCGILLLCFL